MDIGSAHCRVTRIDCLEFDMPEAFPDFDKKPPATPPADSDGTDEAAAAQEDDEAVVTPTPEAASAEGAAEPPGTPGDEAAEPWEAPPPAEDPYESPYHAGIDGSGSRQAEREPAAETAGGEADEAIGLDGTGLAGLMRRWAVARSADASGRQTVLGFADHVEAVEGRLGGVLAKPLRERGMDGLARRVERNPLATIAGAVLAGWIVNKMFD